jgi:hypothetical protein
VHGNVALPMANTRAAGSAASTGCSFAARAARAVFTRSSSLSRANRFRGSFEKKRAHPCFSKHQKEFPLWSTDLLAIQRWCSSRNFFDVLRADVSSHVTTTFESFFIFFSAMAVGAH